MNSTVVTATAAALDSLLAAAASTVTIWTTLTARRKYRLSPRTAGPCSAIGKGQL